MVCAFLGLQGLLENVSFDRIFSKINIHLNSIMENKTKQTNNQQQQKKKNSNLMVAFVSLDSWGCKKFFFLISVVICSHSDL